MTDQPTPVSLEQSLAEHLKQWLDDNDCFLMMRLISPNGGQVPVEDGLVEPFKNWQVDIAPVKKNG